MAFVPSIGETISAGEDSGTASSKPGRYIAVSYDGVDDQTGDPIVNITAGDGSDGWFATENRTPGFFVGNGLFLLHYDKWDQNIFTKSKFRVKKLFKGFYNSRDFDPNGDDSDGPGQALISQLSAAFRPASGQRLLPWWKKRMLRSNPFNADGGMCDKKD